MSYNELEKVLNQSSISRPTRRMNRESNLWKLLSQSLKSSNRKIETTRLENWSVPGVPDVLCCNEKGHFSFLELKIVKKDRLRISPHQVSWLSRHSHGRVFIICRDSNMVIHVFGGDDAYSLCRDKLSSCRAIASFAKPYNWEKFWDLTCGKN